MNVISFVTQKGGTGKSNLVISCAVAASQADARVLILDLDHRQGTASAWYQDREAEEPRLAKVTAVQVEQAATTARAKGFDYLFIDTPGRDAPEEVGAAIRAADLCLIPCRPSPADMKAQPPTAAMVARFHKPTAFILSQAPPRGFRVREAESGLAMLGMVCPVPIVSRYVYQDAQGAGLGVTEYEPNGKAAAEIRRLWDWVERKLRKVQDGQEANVA